MKVLQVRGMALVQCPYSSQPALLDKLTIPIKDYSGKTTEVLSLYKTTPKGLLIPRALVQGSLPIWGEWEDIKIKHKIKLRENQKPIIASFVNYYKPRKTYGGIISAKVGQGKTIIAIYILAEIIKKKTLIVVPTTVLLEQWKQRLLTFTDLKEEEIGLIQSSTVEVKGKKVVLGMIHSLAQIEYPNYLYDEFGLVIFDEGHKLGAKTFSRVAYKFNDMFRLMLSATPRRKDGTENVFFYNIGKVITEEPPLNITPKIIAHKYTGRDTNDNGCIWEGKFNIGRYYTKLARSLPRNNLIAKYVKVAYDKGRYILVLSDRLNMLRSVYGKLLTLNIPELSIGWCIGSKKVLDKQIILGTYQVAGLGADIPILDTLILATPHTDIEQAVGRILREVKNKKRPIVVDIVDVSSTMMQRWFYKRKIFYKKLEEE